MDSLFVSVDVVSAEDVDSVLLVLLWLLPVLSVDPEVPVELFPWLLVFAPVLVVSGVVVFVLEVSGVVVVGAVVVVGGGVVGTFVVGFAAAWEAADAAAFAACCVVCWVDCWVACAPVVVVEQGLKLVHHKYVSSNQDWRVPFWKSWDVNDLDLL